MGLYGLGQLHGGFPARGGVVTHVGGRHARSVRQFSQRHGPGMENLKVALA